jgi:ankyrin repeat protein
LIVQKPEDESDLIHELNSLSPGKDLLLVCDRQNHNLVQWCVLNNYTQALVVLLEHGCNPTRTGLADYDLPLALACCLGRIDMIQYLLDYGANPSETTILSTDILKYLSQETNKERYLKLIDLLKYRNCITSLSIVLTFDDLTMFRLLMGETIRSLSVSGASTSSVSSVNITDTIEDSNMNISETDFDIFREKLKIENYVENIIPQESEECMEHQQQQNIIANDDLSDYADHGHFFSFCDTLDGESAVVNHDDGIQVSFCCLFF